MGAQSDFRFVNISNKKEADQRFFEHVEDARFEDGHSNSGTIAMNCGIEHREKTFETEGDAVDYIEEHAEKYEDTIAVRVKSKNADDNIDGFMYGGEYPS